MADIVGRRDTVPLEVWARNVTFIPPYQSAQMIDERGRMSIAKMTYMWSRYVPLFAQT